MDSTPKSRIKFLKKNLSPGTVFHPTDPELIIDYLIPKIRNQTLPLSPIIQVDNVYDLHPEKIADDFGVVQAEEAYFLTRKFTDERTSYRTAAGGYWRVRGDDEIVKDENGKTLGFRKNFQFIAGSEFPPTSNTYTCWIMNEVRANDVEDDTMMLDQDWTVCRIYNATGIWFDDNTSDEESSDEDE